jgi:hypothetical protein
MEICTSLIEGKLVVFKKRISGGCWKIQLNHHIFDIYLEIQWIQEVDSHQKNSPNATARDKNTISIIVIHSAIALLIANYSPIPGKKSWQELKSVVHEIRKKFSNLNNVYPSNISFRHFVDGRTRIYFLCYPPKFETTLLYVDIYPDGRQQAQPQQMTEENFPQM